MLKELHTAHLGMTKIKTLARGYCGRHQKDKDIDELIRNCSACQVARPEPKKVPTQAWDWLRNLSKAYMLITRDH